MQLYADEDFPLPAVVVLRQLGHDVLTAQEDGRLATPDPDILTRAHALGRSVLTQIAVISSGCTAKAPRTAASSRPRTIPTILMAQPRGFMPH